MQHTTYYIKHSAAASTLHNAKPLPVKCLAAADPDPAVCEAGEPETVELALLLVGLLLAPDVVLVEPALAVIAPVLFTAKLANTTFIALNSWPRPVLPSNEPVHLDPHFVPLFFSPVHC